jgi:hypothetical protein
MKDRFWSKVDKSGDCWLWTASVNRRGYGQFKIYDRGNGKQKVMEAHRLAWLLENGDIPDGLCVCHKCDNPRCVRLDHLFLGTCKENSLDMAQKGRATMYNAKLTEQQVVAIRQEYANGLSSYEIAARLQMSHVAIMKAINGETWQRSGGPIRDRGTWNWRNRYGSKKTGDQF